MTTQYIPQPVSLSYKLFEQGAVRAWTSDIVISEVVFVLSSKHLYNRSREVIRDLLLPPVNLSGIKLQNKRMYKRVFELYTEFSIDYEDAYNAALMELLKRHEIYSYDAHFDRISGLRRLEPAKDQQAAA